MQPKIKNKIKKKETIFVIAFREKWSVFTVIPENPPAKEQAERQVFLFGLMFPSLWAHFSQNLALSAKFLLFPSCLL